MGRLRFVIGALGIVAGFFLYEYGFFLTLKLSRDLSDWTMTLIPSLGSLELMGAVFQLIGGVIAISGLLLCIAWVGSQPKSIAPRLTLAGKREPETRVLVPMKQCKFCGTSIEASALFCPSCKRAQA